MDSNTDHADDARERLLRKRDEVAGRRADLNASVEDMVEASRDSNQDDEHDPEGQTIAASRAQVAALSDAAQRQLRLIDGALDRLAQGEYGKCLRCGADIAPGRLEALPESELCIRCASRRG